jgi:hypothetical protein
MGGGDSIEIIVQTNVGAWLTMLVRASNHHYYCIMVLSRITAFVLGTNLNERPNNQHIQYARKFTTLGKS